MNLIIFSRATFFISKFRFEGTMSLTEATKKFYLMHDELLLFDKESIASRFTSTYISFYVCVSRPIRDDMTAMILTNYENVSGKKKVAATPHHFILAEKLCEFRVSTC